MVNSITSKNTNKNVLVNKNILKIIEKIYNLQNQLPIKSVQKCFDYFYLDTI